MGLDLSNVFKSGKENMPLEKINVKKRIFSSNLKSLNRLEHF